MPSRYELTATQWQKIEPLLPGMTIYLERFCTFNAKNDKIPC